MRQALAAERAGGPTEEAEHPSATARTFRASPEHEPGPSGPREEHQLNTQPKGVLDLKTNLISAIAGWKSAALLALVAMVAAVAFSGVLTTGQTADAQAPTELSGTSVDVIPGTTVAISASGTIVQFSVDGGNGSGSFSNGEQSIACRDQTPCDTNGPTTDDAQAGAGEITVKFTVDADSADGFIVIERQAILPTGEEANQVVIEITTRPVANALKVEPDSTSIVSGATGTTATDTNIKATVTDNQDTPAQIAASVTFVTTNGFLTCSDGGAFVQACTIATGTSADNNVTAGTGEAIVTLTGSGRAGTATVSVSVDTTDLAQEVEIVLSGPAASLSAEPEQGSVEQGGSVFVVLTVLDAGGNPVTGQQPVASAAPGPKAIIGPDKGKAVTTSYDVDKNLAGAKNDIPACGDDVTEVDHDDDGTPPGTDGTHAAELFTADGTNAKGQCVVQVNTDADVAATPNDESTTRGLNTLNFALGTLSASAEVTVAGAAATIATDPADLSYVDPLSDNMITVTVTDDEGVPVGATTIEIVKVGGEGLVEGVDTMTNNGSETFSYTAPFEGQAVFRIRVNLGATQVQEVLRLNIGTPAEPEPEGPAPTWSAEIVSGWNNVTWNGEDGASVADNVGEGVTSIHQWNVGTQSWNSWFAGTEGIPTTVNDFSELENGANYWVASD